MRYGYLLFRKTKQIVNDINISYIYIMNYINIPNPENKKIKQKVRTVIEKFIKQKEKLNFYNSQFDECVWTI